MEVAWKSSYLPPDRWLAQFEREKLSEELRLRGKIHAIAGSTLSSRAVTAGVRRALALHRVLVTTPDEVAAPGQASAGPIAAGH